MSIFDTKFSAQERETQIRNFLAHEIEGNKTEYIAKLERERQERIEADRRQQLREEICEQSPTGHIFKIVGTAGEADLCVGCGKVTYPRSP